MATKTKPAAKATKNAKRLAANPAKPAAVEPQAETKAKPAAKPAAERDTLGCRVGSQSSQINAQLSTKTPKTAAMIAEATGINAARIRAHLLYLVGKQLAKAGDDGHVLVAKK